MEEELNFRASRTVPLSQDALRTTLEETRTALARAQRRAQRSEEQLATFSRQITALWVSVAMLAGVVILLAFYVVRYLRPV